MRVFRTRNIMYDHFPKHGIGAEIGVANGGNAQSLFVITSPSIMHLIDCWEEQLGEYEVDHNNKADHNSRYQEVIEKFKNCPNVKLHKMYSFVAAQLFPDNYLDWIYLDANHMSGGFLLDLVAWWSKIKKGGLMAGHDYCMEKPSIEVKDVLDQWLEDNGLELEFVTNERYPSWAVRK